MSIAYFVPELADAAVRRRIDMLAAGGEQVELFGFDRLREGRSISPPSQAHVLGQTRNQAFLQRMAAVAAALPKMMRLQHRWRTADTILARNLEMLFLATTASGWAGVRPRIVYECLDLHRLMLDRGAIGKALRAIERECLKRVALIVTSSPAFERHFRTFVRYDGPILLAENKVLARPAPPESRPSGPPWRFAWCGVLRCARSFEGLRALAETHPDSVRIELHGVPALDAIPNFYEALARTPNMTYRGPYSAADLPAIYGRAHFAWAIDFYEAGGNSDMLLPNRLYESLAFGAAPIAVDGVETARWLRRNGVGVVLAAPVEQSLSQFLNALDSAGFAACRDKIAKLDPDLVWVTPAACLEFTGRITGRLP